MRVRVEWTLVEGWSDKQSGRAAETVSRDYELPAVPRKGDYIDTGYGDEPVDVVFWPLDESPPTLRLRYGYTADASMDDVLTELQPHGWTR